MCINIIYVGFPGLGFQVKNLYVMFVFSIVSFLFFFEYQFVVDIVQGYNLHSVPLDFSCVLLWIDMVVFY